VKPQVILHSGVDWHSAEDETKEKQEKRIL